MFFFIEKTKVKSQSKVKLGVKAEHIDVWCGGKCSVKAHQIKNVASKNDWYHRVLLQI